MIWVQMNFWQLSHELTIAGWGTFFVCKFQMFNPNRFCTRPSLTACSHTHSEASTHRWMANHEWRMTSWWDVCSPSIYLHKINGSNQIQTQLNRLVWFRFDCAVCCMDQFHSKIVFQSQIFSLSLHNLNDLFMWCMAMTMIDEFLYYANFSFAFWCVFVFFVYCFKTIKNIEFIFIAAVLESVMRL